MEGREFITTPSAFKVVYRVAGACGYIFFETFFIKHLLFYEIFVDLRINRSLMCLMEKLTFQEEEIMLIIWQVKEGVIKDFLNCMEEPRPP